MMYRQADGPAALKVSVFATPLGRLTLSLLTMLLWGSALPVTKLAYRAFGIGRADSFLQIEFVGYRLVVASAILLLLQMATRRSLPKLDRQLLAVVARVAFFQTFLQYLLISLGIAVASATAASLIGGSITFFQLGLAHVRYADDRMTPLKIAAALIGFSGIVIFHVLSSGPLTMPGPGETLMAVAMFFAALGNLFSKEAAPSRLPVLYLTALQMLLGGAALVLVGASKVGVTPFSFDAASFAIFCYLALVSAVSFFLWNSLMSHNKASVISIYMFLNPIFGVCISWILLAEPFNWYVVPAVCLVAAGIVMTQWGSRAAARAN